jgi:hypothetical protein
LTSPFISGREHNINQPTSAFAAYPKRILFERLGVQELSIGDMA